MRAYRLLLVTYYWPPFPGSGGSRWASMVKYLRGLGHEVTVVTTSAFGELPADGEQGVVRTRDLASARLLRRLLMRPSMAATMGGGQALGKPAPRVLTRVVVPDAYLASWVPFATVAARRHLRATEIDCVITSSPPNSVHLAALALGRRRPAWIADLRDGWTFEPLGPPFPTRLQRRLDRWLEQRVMRSADASVCATRPIAVDLQDRLGVAARTIRNAWDPELASKADSAEPPALEDDRVNLVYTGTLGGIRGHDDRGLLSALRAIVHEGGAVAERLRLVVAGPLTESEQRAISSPELSPVVRYVGPLPRAQALALQRRAQALLLITSNHASVATTKLYEYLGAERPILALAGANEAARIVAETGTGITVAPTDVPGIRNALERVATGEFERVYEPRQLDRFRHPAPAEALIETIESVVGSAVV